MGVGWTITITSILSAIALGIVITVVIRYNLSLKTFNLEHNLPLVVNLIPELANGHAMGLEQSNKKRKNGRSLVEMIPIDIRFRDNVWKQKNIELQRIIVGNGHRIALPSGELSSEREMVMYVPRDTANLSKRMQKTIIGDALGEATLLLKITNNLQQGIQEGDKVQSQIIKEWGKGELSRKEFQKQKELAAELQKQIVNIAAQQAQEPKKDKR